VRQRCAEAFAGAGQPGVEGGRRELRKERSTIVAGCVLEERAPQVRRCSVGRSASQRCGYCVPQDRGDLVVVLRCRVQEVSGDDVGWCACRLQSAGSLAVQARGLGVAAVLEDGGGDQRVGEPVLVAVEQSGGHERVTRRGEIGERRARDRRGYVR
jgi:hypothetical protein